MSVRTPDPSWSRASIWSDHDARLARRDRWQMLWVCVGLIVTGYGFTRMSYACSQVVLERWVVTAPPNPAPEPPVQTWPYAVTWGFGQ